MSEFGIDREDQETRLRVAALLVAINVPIYTAIFKGWLWVGWSVMAASLTVWIFFVMFRSQQSVSQGGRPNRLELLIESPFPPKQISPEKSRFFRF